VAITVVLRLLPGPLEAGDLVGQIEHVSTGAVLPVRGAADIVEFARQAAAAAVDVVFGTSDQGDAAEAAGA
jgi:hypothetical protein